MFLYCTFCTAPPYIDYIDPEVFADAGSDVTFVCTVEAFPRPDILWTADVPGVFNPHIVETELSDIEFRSSLTLLSVSLNDTGTYTCHASNSEGEDNVTVELIVSGKNCKNELS